MALRWLTRTGAGRKAGARSAAGSSPAAPKDPSPTMPTDVSSPSARTTGTRAPAAPSPACPEEAAASSPASATATTPFDYYSAIGFPACSCHGMLPPPPLDELPAGARLAVAAVPGKILEEWRHAAMGAWIARPDAADAFHAEMMTAGQLRALLAGRDGG